eukprot:gene11491-4655_t
MNVSGFGEEAIKRKVNEVLNLPMDDLMESMEYISEFYLENTNENKNNLIGILERKSYENYLILFNDFSKVNKELEKLKKIMFNLKEKNERIKNEMRNQNLFLNEINKIESEMIKIKEKEKYILNFIMNYQLTNEEKEIIMIGEINLNFFSIFEKINKIQKECKNMLRNQQKCGIEIIDEMSIYQDTCFERLSRWIQNENNLKNEELFKIALTFLSERQILYHHCLKDMIEFRKSELLKRFIYALSGKKNPIEMNSHDPIIFVSDILSWLHQDCANEKENLDLFLNDETIFNEIYSSLIIHLKNRIQPFFNLESIEIKFKLFHLFDLYKIKMINLLNFKKESCTMNIISNFLNDLKMEYFNKFLKEKEIELINQLNNSNLEILKNNLNLLNLIMKTYLIVDEETKKNDFSILKNLLINSIFSKMENENERNYSLLINSYQFVLNNLLIEFNQDEELNKKLNKNIELFIKQESNSLIEQYNLNDKIEMIKNMNQNEPLSKLLDQETMKSCISSFYSSLFSNGSNFYIQNIQNIKGIKIQNYIRNRILNELLNAYSLIYNEIKNEKNEYKNQDEIVYHTPKKVKILLDI